MQGRTRVPEAGLDGWKMFLGQGLVAPGTLDRMQRRGQSQATETEDRMRSNSRRSRGIPPDPTGFLRLHRNEAVGPLRSNSLSISPLERVLASGDRCL